MSKIASSQKNKFSKYRSYTIEDVSFICDRSRKTIERWIKEGLAPIDSSTKPYFFMGDIITSYLRNKNKSRKWDMSGGSYSCFHCEKGVQAKEKTIRVIGRIKHAKCKICNGNICTTIGKQSTKIRSP
ncbi:hypothetical protein ACFL16_00080 [Patescibacteria group bacterium]